MFKCQMSNCGRQVEHGQPENKIVTETREKQYELRIRRGKKKGGFEYKQGYEIVREISVCPKCFTTHTGREAQTRIVAPTRRPHPKKSYHRTKPRRDDRRPPRQSQQRKPEVTRVNPIPIIQR